MTQTEIDNMIRRLLLEEQYSLLSPELVTIATTEAISQLGYILAGSSPEHFEKKVSISASNPGTHLYPMPSDCKHVKQVWDYGGNVGTVSGAADNGSGLIRITHNIVIPSDPTSMAFPFVFPFGFSELTEIIVTLHDVGGCTEANGIWRAVYVDSTHIDLYGSTFSSAYTSGGKIYIENADVYNAPIDRRPAEYETGADQSSFFHRQGSVVIDYPGFGNDLIMLYRYLPSALSDIPVNLHFGIYAFSVVFLMTLPDKKRQHYQTLTKNLKMCTDLWESAKEMASNFKPVMLNNNIAKRSTRSKGWL